MVSGDSDIEPKPGIGEVGVLALVPDRWEEEWSTRHHVLSRLSKYFHIVWVNPAYGVRPHEWRRRWNRRRARRERPDAFRSWPGLTVYEPSGFYPTVGRPHSIARLLDRQRMHRARRLLTERGCKKVILHVWRPYFARALDLIGHDLACYHIDDEYSFSPVDSPIGESEARLISSMDQVIVTSRGLLEKKGRINPHTRFVPNGADYQAYADPSPEPPDMKGIPHPRIGYSGVIKWTLDWQLITKLILQHPQWHFVFVGPRQQHHAVAEAIRGLSGRPNVHFLGEKPQDRIPAYPQYFDVCIMPYRMDSHSVRYGYPLKLHEYLATGRPTVGTPLYSLLEFVGPVRLARTREEWSLALAESLAPDAMDPVRVEARRTIARQHDWNHLVKIIALTFCERLGPSYLKEFSRIPIS